MAVQVRLYGTLRRLAQAGTPGRWQGELPPGTRVADLIQRLGAGPGEVAAATINGEICALTDEIPAGAEVVLVTHVGGG